MFYCYEGVCVAVYLYASGTACDTCCNALRPPVLFLYKERLGLSCHFSPLLRFVLGLNMAAYNAHLTTNPMSGFISILVRLCVLHKKKKKSV
ncbi:hypothetical protein FKM82_005935 [Ascaphus truei]